MVQYVEGLRGLMNPKERRRDDKETQARRHDVSQTPQVSRDRSGTGGEERLKLEVYLELKGRISSCLIV